MDKVKLIWVLSILFLAYSIYWNVHAHEYLKNKYMDLVQSKDAILDKLDFESSTYFFFSIIADLLMALSIIGSITLIIKKKLSKELPYLFTILGIFLYIRALCLILTPIGNPYPAEKWGLIQVIVLKEMAVFPSGHVAVPLFCILYSHTKKFKTYLWISIIIFILTSLALILAKSHYSIDIIASILFIYAIYSFGEKHLRKRLIC